MAGGGRSQRPPVGVRRRFTVMPATRLGSWAVRLAAANVVLVLAWRITGQLGAFPGFACGFLGGVVALVAIARRGERALAVFAAVLPFVFVVTFVLAELLIGHD